MPSTLAPNFKEPSGAVSASKKLWLISIHLYFCRRKQETDRGLKLHQAFSGF